MSVAEILRKPETLRKMLDERGVEHYDRFDVTEWVGSDGEICHTSVNYSNGATVLVLRKYTTPEQAIEATLGKEVTGETSDGYHTFDELYHHRAVLFSVIVRDHNELAWKSKLHHDGTMYDGMFIVGIETPTGQATYHYDIDSYWEMFDCKELERAPEWDGHTPADAIERIATLGVGTCQIETTENWLPAERYHRCKECGAFFAVLDASHDIPPRYCPNCSRKVMDE